MGMKHESIHTHWHPYRLAGCVILGALILASWVSPELRPHWDALDRRWFFWANGSLAEGEGWQILWAVLNYRAFDAIPGSMLIALFALSSWKDHRNELAQRFAIGVFMALYCVFVIQLVRLLIPEGRLSPTLVLSPAYRLTELVPFIDSKDASTFSFPGDHATVMCLVACFIWYFCGRAYGMAAFVITLLCSIPRVVGGAHWLTDVIISATSIPLIAVSLALCTPLAGKAITRIERYAAPYLSRYFPRWFP